MAKSRKPNGPSTADKTKLNVQNMERDVSDIQVAETSTPKISGDRILVQCRKPGSWDTFRMSAQHNGFKTVARMNATAVLEQGYKNVRT